MHSDLIDLGWTEEQWNRITSVVTEEAQKARVAAQLIPVVGPEASTTVAVAPLSLENRFNPYPYPDRNQPEPPPPPPLQAGHRLRVESRPTLDITTIAVNVPLRGHEVADLELQAALVMFRRAANYIARIEDALVFAGRAGANQAPLGIGAIPDVYTVTGDGAPSGIFLGPLAGARITPPYPSAPSPPTSGAQVVEQVIAAISRLEGAGQLGPYACALSQRLFELICTPTASMVLPRDRILPFLQGPLFRSSRIPSPFGAVIALSGNPIELDVATDINVRFVQTTLEPRWVFRVSERVALRVKEAQAIAILG
jgi:uncharacterized linocin/CFP29 family protein